MWIEVGRWALYNIIIGTWLMVKEGQLVLVVENIPLSKSLRKRAMCFGRPAILRTNDLSKLNSNTHV